MKIWRLFLSSCLCDQTWPMPTQDKALSLAEPPPRGHLPPGCPKQWSTSMSSKQGSVYPGTPLCLRPLFLPHHCLYANCTSRAAKTSHDRIVHNQRGRGSCLQHSYNTQLLRLSRPSNRFEGPDISPCHPPFCSVTKRNLDSRSAHRFLRNSRVLMPDNSGALWLSPSPSARQFIHMSLQSKLQSFRVYFIVSFQFCSLMKLTQH